MRLDTLHGGSIKAWLESLRERPSCQTASADRRRLLEAYRYGSFCIVHANERTSCKPPEGSVVHGIYVAPHVGVRIHMA